MDDGPPPAHPVVLQVTAPLYVLELHSDGVRFDGDALHQFAVRELGPDYSVEALAHHLHLAVTFTRYLLRGERQPSLATYTAILAHLNLPLGTFLRGVHLGPVQGPSQLRG